MESINRHLGYLFKGIAIMVLIALLLLVTFIVTVYALYGLEWVVLNAPVVIAISAILFLAYLIGRTASNLGQILEPVEIEDE